MTLRVSGVCVQCVAVYSGVWGVGWGCTVGCGVWVYSGVWGVGVQWGVGCGCTVGAGGCICCIYMSSIHAIEDRQQVVQLGAAAPRVV